MNMQIRVSSKGQVVIPKDVRDRLKLLPGSALEVVELAGGVFLKTTNTSKKHTFVECDEAVRAAIKYDGPRYTDKEEKASIASMFRKSDSFDH
jgi:AbrB family looped-hinge helix DNA binding protein